MNDDIQILPAVELCLPLSMIKESLAVVESNEDAMFQSSCILSSLQHEVKFTATRQHTHLKICIEKLCFLQKNGVNACTLLENSVASDSKSLKSDEQYLYKTTSSQAVDHHVVSKTSDKSCLTPDAFHSSNSQQKRKRGRPKKSESQKKELNKQNDASSSEKDKTLTKVGEESLVSRGYCLRGKKLNADVMAIEKDELDDKDQVSEDDEDFIPNHDNDINDHEFNENSKSLTNHLIKKVKTTKENVEEDQHRYLIDKEIMNIIGESSCSLLQTLVKRSKITCKYCNEVFHNTSKLFAHVEKLHSECEDSVHFLKEITNEKMNCDKCDEKFNNVVSLQTHLINSHEMKNEFTCPRCDYRGKTWYSLKIHVRNIHLEVGVKKAFCHLCTASFRSHGSLKQHIDLNHFGNRHVKCEVCDKKFYNKSQLRRHSKIHGADHSKRFTCEVCSKSFMFDYNLKRHMSSVHQALAESHHCSYCGKGFSQKTPMISHVQLVHFNLFPYTCTECKNSFPRASVLREHMRCIHGQLDYKVPVLPKNSLYDKTDEDKFYCSYCSSGFVHKIRLIEHMHKDHADAFPYKCDICVQGFLEKSFLDHHSLKVHGNLVTDNVSSKSKDAGQIMQVITTTSGYPSKIVQTVEIQNEEDMTQNGMIAISSNPDETINIHDTKQTTDNDRTSVVVQVDNDGSTYHYVIETPNSIDEIGSEAMVQDIANLLLAAKQNTIEDCNEQYSNIQESTQEVSLTLQDNTEVIDTDINGQQQTVQVQYGDKSESVNIVRLDGTQDVPMEVVVNNEDIDSITLAVEDQEVLNVSNGDIIELNDKSVGKNYYRIVNVVDQLESVEQNNSS